LNRHLLRVILALGLVITLVSGAGVLAVFTDRATTSTNTAESGEVARAADLELAEAFSMGGIFCGQFVDDLTTPLIATQGIQPTADVIQRGYFCLRNVGSASLDVVMSVIDLVDVEIGCTGDEASVDLSCGLDQEGELSPNLVIGLTKYSCVDGISLGFITGGLSNLAVNGMPFQSGSTLAPNEIFCASVEIYYPTTATTEQVQAAQSDRATWRFAFDGTTQ